MKDTKDEEIQKLKNNLEKLKNDKNLEIQKLKNKILTIKSQLEPFLIEQKRKEEQNIKFTCSICFMEYGHVDIC